MVASIKKQLTENFSYIAGAELMNGLLMKFKTGVTKKMHKRLMWQTQCVNKSPHDSTIWQFNHYEETNSQLNDLTTLSKAEILLLAYQL